MSAFSVTDLVFEPDISDFWVNYRRIKQFYFVKCLTNTDEDQLIRSKIEQLEVSDNKDAAIALYEELCSVAYISTLHFSVYEYLSKISGVMTLEDIANRAKQSLEATPTRIYISTHPLLWEEGVPIFNFTGITQAIGRSHRVPATLVVDKELDDKKARRKRIKELKLKSGQIRR